MRIFSAPYREGKRSFKSVSFVIVTWHIYRYLPSVPNLLLHLLLLFHQDYQQKRTLPIVLNRHVMPGIRSAQRDALRGLLMQSESVTGRNCILMNLVNFCGCCCCCHREVIREAYKRWLVRLDIRSCPVASETGFLSKQSPLMHWNSLSEIINNVGLC